MLRFNSILCVLLALMFIAQCCTNDNFEYIDGTRRLYLTCTNLLSSINLTKEMTSGRVKKQYLAQYEDILVVYSTPLDITMIDDFLHGIKMMVAYQQSEYISKVVGFCTDIDNLMLLTNYYRYGSLDRLDFILQNYSIEEAMRKRMLLAIDYTSILHFLHNSPLGVRVMCDSNDLAKTLSQFLVTDDLRLIVNDVDALPEVDTKINKLIKCGHRQLFGDFVAPEQLWPHIDRKYNDDEMHGYDEKTDVWKAPDVLTFILGTSIYANQLKFRLFELFQRCKNIESSLRPTTSEVKHELTKTFDLFVSKSEL